MKVLIAPDKFKDALGAAAVAAAIAAGVRDAIPNAEIEVCPLADGGEGSGELLAGAVGAEERTADVLDPLGSPRRARWWTAVDSRQAIVELAEASGLHLVPPALRNPRRTSSYGTGQLLRAAIDAGATRITLCAGGSATVDAGAGCLQALGFEFFGADERPLATPVCPEALAALQRIRPGPLPACELVILTDVDNPLLGDNGAARV
ncbi:MAG: glycerate kinase, partial [Planctomycetes bacterium]|nr:glycerate kinase [Planctomycetota bacterium]